MLYNTFLHYGIVFRCAVYWKSQFKRFSNLHVTKKLKKNTVLDFTVYITQVIFNETYIKNCIAHPQEIWGQHFQLGIWSTFINSSKILLIYIIGCSMLDGQWPMKSLLCLCPSVRPSLSFFKNNQFFLILYMMIADHGF